MKAQQRKDGFSLIELLAVLLIICLLASATITLSRYGARKAAESAARSEIAAIEGALERYKLGNGTYLASGAASLLTLTNGYLSWPKSKISGTGLQDPYGGVYQYLRPGTRNTTTYDLYCTSFDGNTTVGNFAQ